MLCSINNLYSNSVIALWCRKWKSDALNCDGQLGKSFILCHRCNFKNCILRDQSSAFLFYSLITNVKKKKSYCKIASLRLWDLEISILASKVFCVCNTLPLWVWKIDKRNVIITWLQQSACLMITWGQHYQISAYKDSFTYFSNAVVTDEGTQETLNAAITMRKNQAFTRHSPIREWVLY